MLSKSKLPRHAQSWKKHQKPKLSVQIQNSTKWIPSSGKTKQKCVVLLIRNFYIERPDDECCQKINCLALLLSIKWKQIYMYFKHMSKTETKSVRYYLKETPSWTLAKSVWYTWNNAVIKIMKMNTLLSVKTNQKFIPIYFQLPDNDCIWWHQIHWYLFISKL